jgi:hypothetical protein
MTSRRIGLKLLGVVLLLACLPLDINGSVGLTLACGLATVGIILICTA